MSIKAMLTERGCVPLGAVSPVSDVKMFKGNLFHNKSGDPDISYCTSPLIPLRIRGDVSMLKKTTHFLTFNIEKKRHFLNRCYKRICFFSLMRSKGRITRITRITKSDPCDLRPKEMFEVAFLQIKTSTSFFYGKNKQKSI